MPLRSASPPLLPGLRTRLIELLPAAAAAFVGRELVTLMRVAAFGARSLHPGHPWQMFLEAALVAGCSLLLTWSWGAGILELAVFSLAFVLLPAPVDIFNKSQLLRPLQGRLPQDLVSAAAAFVVCICSGTSLLETLSDRYLRVERRQVMPAGHGGPREERP